MGKLTAAVQAQNLGDIKRLLRNDSCVNERDSYNQTALHLASGHHANFEVVKMLLKKKADVNVQERDGWTPLHCAANAGHFDICELLLNTDGIDVGAMNKDGTSALHYLVRNTPEDTPAAKALFKEVLRLYIHKGGEINSQSKHGESALHQSCIRGNVNAVEFLLENKADMDCLNKIGETPLHYAARASQKEMVQVLLEYGADTSIKSGEGTPLDIASSLEVANMIKQYSSRSSQKTSQAAANEDEAAQFNIEEFKLRVKVVRAVNLTPVGEKDTAAAYCQVSFNKQKKMNGPKANSLSPKWNDVFLFDIEDLSYPLKISLFEDTADRENPGKEDLLGSVTVSLQEVQIDMSGEGNPLKAWYNLKRKPRRAGYKLTPKLRVELSYIQKSRLEETGDSARLAVDSDEETDLTASGAEGDTPNPAALLRGKCVEGDCDCDLYQRESATGGQCQNCGHQPDQHDDLVEDAAAGGGGVAGAAGKAIASVRTWDIDASELHLGKSLGEGTSAMVYRGTYRAQEVAIKVLKEKAEAKVIEEFKKEFDIMSALRSPHVVFFYGATTTPSLCMVLEFCHKGALYDVLADLREDITWEKVFKAAVDTTKGLLTLHNWKPQIVHRDMKSLNLLVDENWAVKVSDFGTSRFTSGEGVDNKTLSKLRGTYAYCAPEVYFGKDYTPKSDIYSMGIILWEMAFRSITGTYGQPFSEFKQIVFDFQIIVQSAKKDVRPTIPDSCPEEYAKLINRCWHKDPEARPTTEETFAELRRLEGVYRDNRTAWDAVRVPAVAPAE